MLSFSEFITEISINVNLNRRQLAKHLSGLGWGVERTKGPHDIYGHTDSTQKIALPRHTGDIPPGTVRDIVTRSTMFDKKPAAKQKVPA